MLSNRGRGPVEAARTRLCIDAKVMSQARVSGIGHTLRGLVTAMQADAAVLERYRITLLVPWNGMEEIRRLELRNLELVRMPMPIRGWDRWTSLRILPPLDMLVGNGIFLFPHYGNWPLRSSRSMTFVHDLAFLTHPETVGGNLGMLRRNASRWIARTNVVATPSEFSKQEIMRYLGVAHERVAVIPWGVDSDVFRPRSAFEIERVRALYGLPQRYVLYVGNFEPRKNLSRLIRAYGRVPAALRSEHSLVLVGGHAWNQADVEAAIAGATAEGTRVVVPPGYVVDADLPAVISGASLLVQPSLHEGFGIAPLQAMACGVAVVVGDNSAQPEVAGDAALRVDVLDEEAIAAAITSALDDASLRSRLVTAGHDRAAQFGWRRTVAALREALDRVAA